VGWQRQIQRKKWEIFIRMEMKWLLYIGVLLTGCAPVLVKDIAYETAEEITTTKERLQFWICLPCGVLHASTQQRHHKMLLIILVTTRFSG